MTGHTEHCLPIPPVGKLFAQKQNPIPATVMQLGSSIGLLPVPWTPS